MTSPVRAISSAELAILRTDAQYSKVRAIIVPQQTVLACKCAETKLVNDAVTTVAINTITSGSYTKVRNGMTCYVGSEAGSDDLGMVRVKSCTATTLTIARVSGITWTPSVYLTVVDDFGLWAKLPTLDLTTIRMDDDIAYTNQNTFMSPTPVFGADTAVPYSAGSYVYNAENSYCLDGSSIINYQWSVYTGGELVSGSLISCGSASSGSMVFTFPAPGSYTVDLKITSGNGKITTGHRTLYVYDDNSLIYKPVDQIKLDSMSGQRDEGGWQCELTAFDGAGSVVRDRAKVIVIAQDYYGGSGISIGQVSGSEHVLMTGWISGENIRYNREFSTVKFTVAGAHYWLKQIVGPSTFLESIGVEPSAWTSIKDMTIDDVIHHFMYWRSTAIEVMDVYRSLNTRVIGGMSASIGSIWDQIADTCSTRMLTNISCDRYGRFHAWVDPQVLPVSDRTSIPVLMAITGDDMTGDVDLKRTIVDPVSLLEVAGLQQSGSAVQMYMSRAPGSLIYNRFGQNDQNDRLVVSSQTDANILSGMLLAKKNNEYGSINVELGQINHMLDIAPAMYVTLSVAHTSNVRQVYFTDLKCLILGIEYKVDDKGQVTVGLELEGETSGIPGYTVIMPQEPIYNFPDPTTPDTPTWDIAPPEYPDYPFPWIEPPIFIPPSPIVGEECRTGTDAYGPFCVGGLGTLSSVQINGIAFPYSAWMRGAGESGSGISYSGSAVSGSWISGSAYYSGSFVSSWQTSNPARYLIEGSFNEINGGLPDQGDGVSGTVFAGSAIGYSASAADSWYDVFALDAYGNVVAVGVHDQVQNPTQRSGAFYRSGSGGDIASIQIKPKATESLFASGSGTYYFETVLDSGTGDCTFLTPYVNSGSASQSTILLNDGVLYQSALVVSPKPIHATYYVFSPSIRVYFRYNCGEYPVPHVPQFYMHVTGSTVISIVDHTVPTCMTSFVGWSGTGGGTPVNWTKTATTSLDEVMPIDQYFHTGLMSIAYLGVEVRHRVRSYGKGDTRPVIIRNYYKFDQIPTYQMVISNFCLYNVCAPSWVP